LITEPELQEAIAYYQGKLDPNSNDVVKLAACLIVHDMMFGKSEQPSAQEEPLRLIPSYSYAPPPNPVETTVDYESDTDFGQMIYGRNAAEIWPIIDELVSEAMQALNPRLYDAFMRKLKATKSPG
jgi:hypothetical protein